MLTLDHERRTGFSFGTVLLLEIIVTTGVGGVVTCVDVPLDCGVFPCDCEEFDWPSRDWKAESNPRKRPCNKLPELLALPDDGGGVFPWFDGAAVLPSGRDDEVGGAGDAGGVGGVGDTGGVWAGLGGCVCEGVGFVCGGSVGCAGVFCSGVGGVCAGIGSGAG